MTATINEDRSNPVTLTPKIRLPKNPPSRAPNIPKSIVPNNPPLDGLGSITFAIQPTISPNNIQANIFINLSHPLLGVSKYYRLRLRDQRK